MTSNDTDGTRHDGQPDDRQRSDGGTTGDADGDPTTADSTSGGVRAAARSSRRAVLKSVGLGAAVVPVAATEATAADGVADGPTARTYEAVPLDPTAELTQPTPPNDPDIDNAGSGESEEVPRGQPTAEGSPTGGTGSPLPSQGGQDLAVGTNFDGLGTRDVVRGVDLNDDGVVQDDEIFFIVPSDAQIGTGPDHHLEVINSDVAIFEKDGTQLFHFRLEDWFENVLSLAPGDEPPAQFENTQVFDPRVRFDRATGRFLIACVEFNLADTDAGTPIQDPNDFTGAFLLSISDTSDPTGTWTNYRIPPLSNFGLVDFPQLGYGPDAAYLTQNFFAINAEGEFVFDGATFVTLDKTDLLAGDDVDALHFTDLRNPDGSLAFTVQPARIDSDPGEFYLVNSKFGEGQSLTVWTVQNPTDPASVSVTNEALPVRPYTNAPAAEQPGTEDTIDVGDSRLPEAVAFDPSDGHLWAAHTVNDGSARWYEIDPTGPSVVQSNTYRRQGLPTFFPAIETNGDSTVFVYNTSGPQAASGKEEFASVEVAGRTDDFTQDRIEDFAVVEEGESPYDLTGPGEGDEGVQTARWGDYNGVSIDPEDGSYWVVSQYANDPDTVQTYGTRIANVDFDS